MTVIDDRLKDATPAQRAELLRIRDLVKKLVPDAEEVLSYGMPTLKYKGRYLIYLNAFKNHMSIFPGSALTEELRAKLTGFKLSKGTIQFTEDNLVPDSIIEEIVNNRLKSINKS